METNNNAQLCENEEILDEPFNRFKKQNIDNPEKEANRLVEYLKNNNVIEFYDIYP